MIEYPAHIKYSNPDKCFLVDFPDLPGCLTYGSTLDEAIDSATEALSGYLESIDMRKISIPLPSEINSRNIFYIAPKPKTAFAVWMKIKRTEKGLTQKKAAILLNMSLQGYQKFENPELANPTLTTIKKIEKVFNERIILI